LKKVRILGRILRTSGADRIIYGFLGFVALSACAIWLWEPENATFPEALWYCFTAISTIGFGNVVVHGVLARTLTVLLSIYAAAVLAIFTAVVVNYFQQIVSTGRQEDLEAFLDQVERLPNLTHQEMEALARQAKKWNHHRITIR